MPKNVFGSGRRTSATLPSHSQGHAPPTPPASPPMNHSISSIPPPPPYDASKDDTFVLGSSLSKKDGEKDISTISENAVGSGTIEGAAVPVLLSSDASSISGATPAALPRSSKSAMIQLFVDDYRSVRDAVKKLTWRQCARKLIEKWLWSE
jgi:hypothetical protein